MNWLDLFRYMSNSLIMSRRPDVFKALADPTRREILKTLQGGSRTAGEIAASFDMSRPSLSHHFNVLKGADLVRTRREGQHIIYSLNTTVIEEAVRMLIEMFAQPPGSADQQEKRS